MKCKSEQKNILIDADFEEEKNPPSPPLTPTSLSPPLPPLLDVKWVSPIKGDT